MRLFSLFDIAARQRTKQSMQSIKSRIWNTVELIHAWTTPPTLSPSLPPARLSSPFAHSHTDRLRLRRAIVSVFQQLARSRRHFMRDIYTCVNKVGSLKREWVVADVSTVNLCSCTCDFPGQIDTPRCWPSSSVLLVTIFPTDIWAVTDTFPLGTFFN